MDGRFMRHGHREQNEPGMASQNLWSIQWTHGNLVLGTDWQKAWPWHRNHCRWQYEGEWQDGRWHGSGTVTYTNGNHYTGEFKMSLRHGHGSQTFADGSTYKGEWKDDDMHSPGTSTWKNGSWYTWQFNMGKRGGHCKQGFPDGSRYEGECQDTFMHGSGTLTYKNGDQYFGQFLAMANGRSRYEGEWQDDLDARFGNIDLQKWRSVHWAI